MNEVFNVLTMVPGLMMAAYFVPWLPRQAMSYMLFCIFSVNYHIAKQYDSSWKDIAFNYDILSQLVACMYNADGYGKFFVFPYWWFALNGTRNRKLVYTVNAICILLTVYPCASAFNYMLLAFMFFLGGLYGFPCMHGLFHIFGHVSVYMYWTNYVFCDSKIYA